MSLGSDLSLLCAVAGCPVPTVSWSKDGSTLTTSGRMVVTADGTLSISTVLRRDSGRYTCTASNTYGKAVSSAEVVVTGMNNDVHSVGDDKLYTIS